MHALNVEAISAAHRRNPPALLRPRPSRPLKHLRYPWKPTKERRLTIAIGILARGGVVLAADSQMTAPGFLKNSRTKIIAGQNSTDPGFGVIGIVGAGHVGYSDSIRAELVKAFRDSGGEQLEEVEAAIKSRVKEFYTDHVLPFTQLGDNERPEFQLLIGAQRGEEYELWATDRGTVRPCPGYEAIGSGALYANILLHELRAFPEMDISTAKTVAAYVIHKVKQCVDGCGMQTHIVCLANGKATLSNDEESEAFERLFSGYEWVEQIILDYIFHRGSKDPALDQQIENLRKLVGDLTLAQKSDDILDRPKPIRNASGHRGRNP